MTLIEFVLSLIIILLVIFIIYWYLAGSRGTVSFRRPVESRVDEYLDLKFEQMMKEWSLVNQSGLKRYRSEREGTLSEYESSLGRLSESEAGLEEQIRQLEDRLNELDQTARKEKGSR